MIEDTISFLGIGAVGTGFRAESLERGLAMGVDFIGADAGTSDGGPTALAGAGKRWPTEVLRRDIELLMLGAKSAGVPLLIGSCGTSGRDWGVDLFAEIAREIATDSGEKFTIARIYSELPADLVVERIEAGRVHPIEPAPEYGVDAARRSQRIVGVMGVEPFQEALSRGADVVLAGRSTDAAIFAAIPLDRGFDPGLAWHAGKIAECGTACAEPRRRLDVIHIELDRESFVVQPLADNIRCTPFSVAAHQLHEVTDPFTLVEPGWVIDLTEAHYEAETDSAVRVTGGTATPARYTVKLEGVESAGWQRMFMFGVRDPTILADLDAWQANIEDDIISRCTELLGPEAIGTWDSHVRVYGRDGVMGDREPVKEFNGHEVFLVIDVVAPDERTCETVTSVIQYAFVHAKSPGWRGGTTLAWPFPKASYDLGEVYRFNVHHAMEVNDPLEVFRIELEEVGP